MCWEPRSRRSGAALLRKVECCIHGYPSTHWASLGYFHDFIADAMWDDAQTGCTPSAAREDGGPPPPEDDKACARLSAPVAL